MSHRGHVASDGNHRGARAAQITFAVCTAVGCGRIDFGASVPATWIFDSAGDFAAPGHDVGDMTIEARGSLTPNAYTYGGLVLHGLQGVSLWAAGDTSWTKLDGVTASGSGMWHGESLTMASVLDYIGIADQTTMTIWFEGEVWLDAGSTELFALGANDVAFVELAQPGSTTYARVLEGATTAAIATPQTGWYPIRIGCVNSGASFNFGFQHSDSGTVPIAWTRDRLRARASELEGALRTVFFHQLLGGGEGSLPPVAQFDEHALLTAPEFIPPPQGADAQGLDWSARYLGQVYLQQPGTYTLQTSGVGGIRSRFGGGGGEAGWLRGGAGQVSGGDGGSFEAGWNDLVVDYNHGPGAQGLSVTLDGPGFAGVEIPADQLRPVEPSDDRLTLGGDDTAHTIIDNGGAGSPGTATMSVVGYPGETVTAIDLTYEINSPRWDQLKVDLEAPGAPGTRLTIRNLDGGLGNGDQIAAVTLGPELAVFGDPLGALLGGPAGGTWKLHAYDVVNGGGNSRLVSARLTVHSRGGPDKVARTASWTSPVLAQPTDVIAIDGVTWDERLPAGAAIEVRLRTCRQADCSDGVWLPPVSKLAPFTVAPARYLQLRVDLTCDGIREPELRSLGVMFRREPG